MGGMPGTSRVIVRCSGPSTGPSSTLRHQQKSGSFQKTGAPIFTLNSRALMPRAPTQKDPQIIDTAMYPVPKSQPCTKGPK